MYDPSRLNEDVATRERREEETAKESGEAKDKSFEDYSWFKRCEDVTKLKKGTCSRTKHVLKPTRAEAAFEEQQKWERKGNSKTFMLAAEESSQSWPTKNASTLTQNVNRASADSGETDESDKNEYESDAIDSGGEDDSSDVVLAFINLDE